jgi:hypothetical protein
MRDSLGRAGKTIVVSSHILAEVEEGRRHLHLMATTARSPKGAVRRSSDGGGAPQVRLGHLLASQAGRTS